MAFLPDAFKKMMEPILKEEYPHFLKTFKKRAVRSLRINTLKTSPQIVIPKLPFHLSPIPWIDEGCYYDPEKDNP